MILKSDRLADLLEQSAKPNAVDPFAVIPRPPLDELRNSGSASIDLRLGTWFSHARQAQIPLISADARESDLTSMSYVPFGEHYILHPQSFILAITLEWICIPRNLAAYVIGKSSWGRCGLIIATAVGVHPGYKGCLTLELTNVGEIPLAVFPGDKICQLFVHQVDAKDPDIIEISDFSGMRRPWLKPVEPDIVARTLREAYEQ